MNEAIRRARLRGAREAERILSILDVRQRLLRTYERVDVFDALAWLDVLVVFRPLSGLLGAYIRGTQPGAMITTNRPLSVQRFTAAHELGHAVLNHEPSLDSPDVLRRAAHSQPGPRISGFASYLQEIEADAFAGALLLPMWLIAHHAKKHDWSRAQLANEDVIYQLALRCGASFQATVWALERHRIITSEDRARLLQVKPKAIKARLDHGARQGDSRADAWVLTEGDAGAEFAVVKGDTVAVSLTQRAGSGYLWRVVGMPGIALEKVGSEAAVDNSTVGAPSRRTIGFKAAAAGLAELRLEHRRPWEKDAIHRSSFDIVVEEPERGLSRANRARMAVQARQRHGVNAR